MTYCGNWLLNTFEKWSKGETIMLQYELAIGPSTGKAVTTLKRNLRLCILLGQIRSLFQFISLEVTASSHQPYSIPCLVCILSHKACVANS